MYMYIMWFCENHAHSSENRYSIYANLKLLFAGFDGDPGLEIYIYLSLQFLYMILNVLSI